MSSTATTHAARDHARSQAGHRAETQQTLPASAATGLPAGVAADRVVWDETLPAGGYASRVLRRGATVRLTDLKGDACVQLLALNADRPFERMNVADIVKVQWNAYPGKGSLLLSDMGRVLMSIVEDTRGRNDAFCGASSAWSNQKKYGAGAGNPDRPNARDRFTLALARHGLSRRDIGPSVSLFKGVRVEPDGAVTLLGEPGAAGDAIELRAEMNVLLALANCPHVLDRRSEYAATPVRVTGWRGRPTDRTDPLWSSTPEVERAFFNTEDYFLA